MPLIIGVHYAAALALELALLFGFGLFGFRFAGGGWAGDLLAAVLVGSAILLWARFAAPRAATRLPAMPLLAFKTAIFALGALAFWAAGWREAALVFGAAAALDLGLAAALKRI